MKKLLFLLLLVPFAVNGQKITALTEATSATSTSLIYVRAGATGDLIKKITKANFLSGYATYPAAGIPLSTGVAWGTSITNNSANWNTAYGWGDHSTAGYVTSGHTQAETSITFTDITTGDATTDKHGFLPRLGGGTSNYLRADGTWATPAGGSGMVYPGDGIAVVSGGVWTTSLVDNSTNWNTAYSDRLKWDGGSTGLTAATGRTSLGATTIGTALFTLTNPGAVSFIRMNADNSVTSRSAANFKLDLSLTSSDVGLGNVDNENKLSMFSNPAFTGSSTFQTAANPSVSNGASLGTTSLMWSDLFLASGAVINFNNGDVNLTHSSNTLTLSGGNLALGANDLTITGSIAATGSRVTKGWFTNLEITNLPTVNGGTLKTALSLTAGDVGLGSVTNESKTVMFTNPVFTGLQKVGSPVTDTLATKAYARSVAGYDFDARLDDVEEALADTVSLNTIVTMQSDTIPLFTVGGGNGLRGSQAAFLPGADLGGFSNTSTKDTLYITSGRFFVVADSGIVTMGFKFYKHATQYPTSAATDMMSAVITLSAATSATGTGTVITHSSTPHFDVFTLLPGESIAAIVTVKSNGNMPKLMRGTIYGIKRNRKY